MSIFPKRTVPGKGVTIHWNFNTSHLRDVHIFPFVRIGVRNPDGKETMLFEDHVLALPDPLRNYSPPDSDVSPTLKYLNKNTPLLVLADYLSGAAKKEALVDILGSIQSGRHFYFYFPVAADAPPGKYTLISEVHSSGQIRHSKTAADDFFFVERLTIKSIDDKKSRIVSTVYNPSPEPTPVKIVECYPIDGKLKANIRVCEIPPLKETSITCLSRKSYLLYNEEREIIPLHPDSNRFALRNQFLMAMHKEEDNTEVVFVMEKQNEKAYKLHGPARELWNIADGLVTDTELKSGKNHEVYEELLQTKLLQEISFVKAIKS